MATAGKYFEVKVTFREEAIPDSAFLSSEAEDFEKGVIGHLRDQLGDADVEIRLYGSPRVGCFEDSVWIVIAAASQTLAVAAIGGVRLREAIEHAVFDQWPNNVREMRVRLWPVIESPDAGKDPPAAPEQTYTYIPRDGEPTTSTGSPPHAPPPPPPLAAPPSSPAPSKSGLGWRDLLLVLFALLVGFAYWQERTSDAENTQEITDRLSRIESKIDQPSAPIPPVTVECRSAPVRVTCPATSAAPTTRSYSSRTRD